MKEEDLEKYEAELKINPDFISRSFNYHWTKKQDELHYIIECAKLYIIKNWHHVDDWCKLELKLYEIQEPIDNDAKKGPDINNFKRFGFRNAMGLLIKELRVSKNKITGISKFKIDPINGELSAVLTTTKYGKFKNIFVQQNNIIELAIYIERAMHEKKE